MSSTVHLPPGAAVATRVDGLRAELLALSTTLWAARSGTELAEVVVALESLRSTVAAVELAVVAELDTVGGVAPLGWASTGDFVTAVSGGRRGSGAASVRLATALTRELFSPVADALREGWLSEAKARVVTTAVDDLPVTADRRLAVSTMLAEARWLDAGELARVGRHLLRVVDPDGEDARDERALEREARVAHHRRGLSVREDGAGGARLVGRCSVEDAALIRTTLFSLAAPRPAAGPTCEADTCRVSGCRHDGRDPRDHGARMLDALVALCERAQTADVLPHQHGAPTRLSVLIDYRDLLGPRGEGLTDDGLALDAVTLRRLACDAELIPVVLGAESQVLDVGRARRPVTPPIWRALVARDRHCRFPGCNRPPVMCHAHHLVHWADGGPTSVENLLLLCGHHHRLVHDRPWHLGLALDGHAVFRPPPGVGPTPLDGPRPAVDGHRRPLRL